jgi:hypothetical protein
VAGPPLDALDAAVRALEQALHGVVARAARARAEHLAVVANGIELKTKYVVLFVPFHATPGAGLGG